MIAAKQITKDLLEKIGLRVFKLRSLRFGVEFCHDLIKMQPASDIKIIFDVGANQGQTATELARRFPHSRICSFEPFPLIFARLQSNTCKIHNIETFPFAFGASEGSLKVPVRADPLSQLHSLLPINYETATESPRKVARIELRTLDSFCSQQGVENIDLLKIDTEGFELQVLSGGSGLLERGRVDFIYAECEFERVLSETHTSFFALYNFLADHDFRLVTVYTDDASREGFSWGSALFAHQ